MRLLVSPRAGLGAECRVCLHRLDARVSAVTGHAAALPVAASDGAALGVAVDGAAGADAVDPVVLSTLASRISRRHPQSTP